MKIGVVWLVIKFIVLIFASFELFSIITKNNKKMSIAGTLVLAFSGCVMWNLEKIDSIILGEIITVLIYKIIFEKKYKKIILMSLAIVASCISYIYTFRPFAISFGYLFLALIIWVIAENRKARFDYFIEDNYECGIALEGTEVKSVKNGNISFYDCTYNGHIANDEIQLKWFQQPQKSISVCMNDDKKEYKKYLEEVKGAKHE